MKKVISIKTLPELTEIPTGTLYNYRMEGMPAVLEKPLRFDYDQVIEWLKTRIRKEKEV